MINNYIHILRVHISQANEYLRQFEPTEIIFYTLLCVTLPFMIKKAINLFSDELQIKATLFRFVTNLPYFRDIKNEKIRDVEISIFKSIHGKTENLGYQTCMPKSSKSMGDVLKLAESYDSGSMVSWKDGRMSGAVYPFNEELNDLLVEIQKRYLWSNPLHVDAFPAVRRMEAEVVKMCIDLFHGDSECCGTMTSGGTESLLLACLAYRNRAYKLGIRNPEIVVPVSVHASFDKAGTLMNIKIKKVPLDPVTFKVDLKAMRQAITRRTCLLVGSAPQFPQGIIDDIEGIAELGMSYDIPVHVDSCLGGFLVPFMDEAGYSLAPFDFRLPGVTSISCDTHKYGFAAKGTSVIMYRNKEFRKNQFFLVPNWTGGIYASPTFAGSRSGALIAASWAALMYFGREGYVKSSKRIISTARKIAEGVASIPGLRVLGDPQVSVIAFTSDVFDIYQLAELVSRNSDGSPNWSLNALQYPSAVHFCVTDVHTQPGLAQRFLDDLRDAAERLIKEPKKEVSGMAAIYGMCAQIPDRTLVSTVVASFLDACYATKGPSD
ncbi:unnamed protein product [Hymenolepis diminuta]|uniref:sphinganine-1-phosphate aldolase n=2 Tax=Hymenolepis diminuta TaxID=6216 RepID=A0A564Y7S9_HYMDI|nr:unnamed protein product [Hymenolepis diminuta]